MPIDFMLEIFKKNQEKEAIIWKDQIYHYKWLLDRMEYWKQQIQENNIAYGAVTIIEADFSPNAIALFLALANHGCILVPLTNSIDSKKAELIEIAQGEISFILNENDRVQMKKMPYSSNHEFYQKLRNMNHPGLILFSSGSTGKSKAAVHDLNGILEKFKMPRHKLRTLTFLLFDHIGGINTLFYSLSNGSCIITIDNRLPDNVCRAIEKYQVESLPVSPTFLNLLVLSEAHLRYNLSSLKYITYGTEVMPQVTLNKCTEIFPDTIILQTYGTTEVGILRSKSKSSDSLWVKVGGEEFETRIVDGILQIKAKSAMMGYLNAPSPFTDDGWFHTGDAVEEDGEYIKILGRKSEIINVGGAKVYPAEVETVIQEMPDIEDVTVYGEKNPITGNIVCAKVNLLHNEEKEKFSSKLKKFCRGRLESYKIPVKIKIITEKQHNARFKKIRPH